MTDTLDETEELVDDYWRDPTNIDLLLSIPSEDDAVFAEYIDYVAKDGLLSYKNTIQYGSKAGESLYTHIINGICTLQQLRHVLALSEIETRVLFTAYTIHDINKMVEQATKYRDLVTVEQVADLLVQVRLDEFLPGYDTYLHDLRFLMLSHSAHLHEGLDLYKQRGPFGLGRERVRELVPLIRAADTIDLSQSLDERRKKDEFLSHLNEFSDTQYEFVTHRVSEQRGSFTNIVHNAAMDEMQTRFAMLPLLMYPDGTAYLCAHGQTPTIDKALFTAVAKRVSATINEMTAEGFTKFIRPMNMGITVDSKCLELGLPFNKLLGGIDTILQKRQWSDEKLQSLANDSTRRTRELLVKQAVAADLVAQVEELLKDGSVPHTQEAMRVGDLLRTYYIFLLEHGGTAVPDPWMHLYILLNIPDERRPVYEAFNARLDRAYAIIGDRPVAYQTLYTQIQKDGTAIFDQQARDDPRVPLLETYLHYVLTFATRPLTPANFAAAMPSYVQQQHKQCVQCSLPLPTEKWSASDVRSDIKVQSFSNRLGGGPGEPKKRVCAICHLQFLVEKLNYIEIRGEQTAYLHLFPYSFQSAAFVNSQRATIKGIVSSDQVSGALRFNNIADAFQQQKLEGKLNFTAVTKEGKRQPYGIYLPRYSDTVGSILTFPINPAGGNNTDQFIFILQHALLLHHVFGSKVLVSTSATPPLNNADFGDVYFDLTPLSARGLIRQNDYAQYEGETRKPGSLHDLWKQLVHLYHIRRPLLGGKDDPIVDLVRAMAEHPLAIFYTAEKLAEGRARGDGKSGAAWIIAQIGDAVRDLALSIGDPTMKQLDTHLKHLAQVAKAGNLRGSSWKKSSMITAMDEVLRKVGMQTEELSPAVLQAAAVEDLYDHIARTRKLSGYQGGRKLRNACEEFVRVFFDDIFNGVYQGKVARLLNHEKVLRSAYHFYLQQQYANQKSAPSDEDMPFDDNTDSV